MGAYGRLSTAFYDLDKPQPPADALAFYQQRARDARGPVLEPMCGSGRFLLPLREAGIDVDGTDNSADMLDACRARAAARGFAVRLHAQSLTDLQLDRRYALAFVPSGSIGLLDDASLDAALARLRAHLLPRGTLLLELIDAAAARREAGPLAERSVAYGDGATLTYRCTVTPRDDGRALCYAGHYVERVGGRVVAEEREDLVLHLYEAHEIERAARGAGFGLTRRLYAHAAPAWLGGNCLYECLGADAAAASLPRVEAYRAARGRA